MKETPSREHVPVSIEDVLLHQKWSIHCVSPLYRFHAKELSKYAVDLVKVLRQNALTGYREEFGYTVSIRTSSTFVVFDVKEDRGDHVVSAGPGEEHEADEATKHPSDDPHNENQPSPRDENDSPKPQRPQQQQRSGRRVGFVLYFPPENCAVTKNLRPHEQQQVLLLRGSQELMAWVCSWIQRRFQCIVGRHVFRVSSANLDKLAKQLVVEAVRLRRDAAKKISSSERNPDASSPRAPAQSPPRPLLLEYKSVNEKAVVKNYTLTVPWYTVDFVYNRSISHQQGDGPPPDIIPLIQKIYFDQLPFETSSFVLHGIQLAELALDSEGNIKFHQMSMIHQMLQNLLELFVVQKAVSPCKAETTF